MTGTGVFQASSGLIIWVERRAVFVSTPFLPAIRLPLNPLPGHWTLLHVHQPVFRSSSFQLQLFPLATWTLQEEGRGQALAACWALSQVLNSRSLASTGTWRAQTAIGLFLVVAASNNWKPIEGGSRRDTDLSLKPSHASPLKYNRKPCFVIWGWGGWGGGK